jgi:hypothetical protein
LKKLKNLKKFKDIKTLKIRVEGNWPQKLKKGEPKYTHFNKKCGISETFII